MADLCMYCDKTEKLHSLMLEVGKLKYSTLYYFKDQVFLGHCVLAGNFHRKEIFDMTDEEREGFFKELAVVSQAIKEVFNPDKINLGMFGDTVPHFHAHIVPKYEGGLNWGRFCHTPEGVPPVFLSDEQKQAYIDALKAKLGLLSPASPAMAVKGPGNGAFASMPFFISSPLNSA